MRFLWLRHFDQVNGIPEDETQAVLSAIEKSSLNAFSYIDKEGALLRAENADVSLPLGGVPIAVKELHNVDGWPDTGASLVLKTGFRNLMER